MCGIRSGRPSHEEPFRVWMEDSYAGAPLAPKPKSMGVLASQSERRSDMDRRCTRHLHNMVPFQIEPMLDEHDGIASVARDQIREVFS